MRVLKNKLKFFTYIVGELFLLIAKLKEKSKIIFLIVAFCIQSRMIEKQEITFRNLKPAIAINVDMSSIY